MRDSRAHSIAAIISRASEQHQKKALRRWLAVVETQMLQALGHTACAAVAEVAVRHGVSARAIWKWRALVYGEFDAAAQLRWLLDGRAIRSSGISPQEVRDAR
jgi:hypothetical protein